MSCLPFQNALVKIHYHVSDKGWLGTNSEGRRGKINLGGLFQGRVRGQFTMKTLIYFKYIFVCVAVH